MKTVSCVCANKTHIVLMEIRCSHIRIRTNKVRKEYFRINERTLIDEKLKYQRRQYTTIISELRAKRLRGMS